MTVMRNGQAVHGQLSDIGGTRPLRLTFSVDGNQRDYNSGEVARIYLSVPPGAVATTGTTPTIEAPPLQAGGAGMAVPGNQQWTSTGITVRQNDVVTFTPSGQIRLSSEGTDIAGTAGAQNRRFAPNAPIPNAYAGALIGRVGNSAPFAIGDQTSPLRMPASGELFLGINDDHVADNQGHFNVVVTPQSGNRRR
jgi:hypothetical protein